MSDTPLAEFISITYSGEPRRTRSAEVRDRWNLWVFSTSLRGNLNFETLYKRHSYSVSLSANRTTLELSGPSARAVLEKSCHLDLHPRSFAVGTAEATTLGPVQVLLWRTAELTWRIMPRSSFAEYTARWLLDAMTEFSAPEVP